MAMSPSVRQSVDIRCPPFRSAGHGRQIVRVGCRFSARAHALVYCGGGPDLPAPLAVPNWRSTLAAGETWVRVTRAASIETAAVANARMAACCSAEKLVT